MNNSQHNTRTDAREKHRLAAERRRLRAFTASEASGGAGLTEEEAKKLFASLESKNTQ